MSRARGWWAIQSALDDTLYAQAFEPWSPLTFHLLRNHIFGEPDGITVVMKLT